MLLYYFADKTEVLALVHGAGLDAVHVGGGVAAWVSQVDPTQAVY